MNRLAIAGLALLIVAVAGYHYVYGKSRYNAGYAAAEAAMQARVKEANDKAAVDTKIAQDRSDRLEKDLADKTSDLTARLAAALARAPVVRVQKCPGSRELPKTATASPEHHDDADRSGPDSEDGGDIAPQLLRYARDAEALRLAVVACQAYGKEIEQFR